MAFFKFKLNIIEKSLKRNLNINRAKSTVGNFATEVRRFFGNKGVKRVITFAAMVYGGWLLAGKGSLATGAAAGGGTTASTVVSAPTVGAAAGGGTTATGTVAAGGGTTAAGGGGGLIAEAGGAESLFTAKSLGEGSVIAGSSGAGAGAGGGGFLSSSATSTVGASTTSTGLTTAQVTLAGYGVQALGGALQAAEAAKSLRDERKSRKVTFAEPSKGRLKIIRRVPTKKERGLIEVASEGTLKPKNAPISRVAKEKRTNLFEAI